ncbi:MAG: hypothetical protein A2298_03205 [Gammaproteobacteria bacterium RIFOXYB2_FULL_38_6]|nr:MAG: hypothetical protein A2298_03205 [Gammaproteobacteria bacterium RIFOXYB2_FULL_38_6]
MKKISAAFPFLLLFMVKSAWAICPICTIAVGAGIGLSEYLGIDDTITGLWVGALVVSVSFWTSGWMKQKGWRFPLMGILILIAYYLIVVFPLYWPMHYIGRVGNTLWGMDKLLLGIIVGSIVFFFASIFHFYLKAENHDKVYFPFQKVVIPVVPLIIFSFIFYLLT